MKAVREEQVRPIPVWVGEDVHRALRWQRLRRSLPACGNFEDDSRLASKGRKRREKGLHTGVAHPHSAKCLAAGRVAVGRGELRNATQCKGSVAGRSIGDEEGLGLEVEAHEGHEAGARKKERKREVQE